MCGNWLVEGRRNGTRRMERDKVLIGNMYILKESNILK